MAETTDKKQDVTTWPDLGMSIYDKLTGRGAEITYEFKDLEVYVPSSTDPKASSAKWKLNGSIKIRTQDRK